MSPGKREPRLITSPNRSKDGSEITYDLIKYEPVKNRRLWGKGTDTARVDPYGGGSGQADVPREPAKTGDG